MVPLAEFLRLRETDVEVSEESIYHFAGVYCFGKGVFSGKKKMGMEFAYKRLTTLRTGDFVYPKLMAWEGAFGVVPSNCDGLVVSTEFPVFQINHTKAVPGFVDAYFRRPSLWPELSGASTGTNVRRRRLHPKVLLEHRMPLPPVSEQERIVEKIQQLTTKVDGAQSELAELEEKQRSLLASVFHESCQGAARLPLKEVAPLIRRPARIAPTKEYPGISVRSFGRGTFHNPPLPGGEITWQKLYEVKSGDILVSNIKAWEGAISVAGPEDDGRFGSHRYLTFVPIEHVATARFVCFYLLSREGLRMVGEASPGSADRNRTTSSKAMLEIPIPVPSIERQRWFGSIHEKMEEICELQDQISKDRAAFLPALLNQVFTPSEEMTIV
jgi:type I restriction enzyme S subunit